MNTTLLLSILAVPLVSGIVGTRIWVKRREHGTISSRLARWASQPIVTTSRTLLKRPQWSSLDWQFLQNSPTINFLKTLLDQAGLENKLNDYLILIATLLLAPVLIALIFELNAAVAFVFGLILAAGAIVSLSIKANALRTKFCEQLPDAIDLIVAVLRSGHSIPQAVKAVSQEIPAPCGLEFQTILHRMNLGQPLSQALILSAKRFRSYELDLIRRAVAIQAEVGGSLAELLDKTNSTLRERLKLARQLKVVTAQSRLSAQIIGLMPVILAIGLNFITPGYLQYLISDKLGQALVGGALLLEMLGLIIMNRMSTMKV